MKIRIKPGEHVAFMGTTGSGKTVLARHLLEPLRRAIVIDPKLEWRGPGWKRKFSLPVFDNEFRRIWAPSRNDDARLADLLRKAWRKGNVTIYIDELQSLSDFFPRATDELTDIIRTGRSRLVAVWSAMQRPYWVPRHFISESRHKFVFTLLDKKDRRRAADVIGDSADVQLDMHNFLYHTVGLDSAHIMRYNLKTKIVKFVK